jgi:DeoR family transcriptional regulator, glycerol-3-phosphate regulon repressor
VEQITPRQIEIMDLARLQGRVDVDGLADRFEVTPQTIRKDLNELCERQLLARVHGGAVFPRGIANFAYESRRVLAAEGKRLIGERAAALIPDNASIILNIGTTTEQVAMALRRHTGIMAVTNNINVANILRDVPSAEVVISGGVVRHADGGVVGEAAVDFMRQFRADYAVIGASAIDLDGTLLDYDHGQCARNHSGCRRHEVHPYGPRPHRPSVRCGRLRHRHHPARQRHRAVPEPGHTP